MDVESPWQSRPDTACLASCRRPVSRSNSTYNRPIWRERLPHKGLPAVKFLGVMAQRGAAVPLLPCGVDRDICSCRIQVTLPVGFARAYDRSGVAASLRKGPLK
jgi:hypothetical protein